MNLYQLSIIALLGISLVSCQKPQDAFEAIIQEQGFIPYKAPTQSASVGTLIRGNNVNNMNVFATADECFPREIEGVPTRLTWFDAVDLPSFYKEFSVNFNADISTISQNGNPAFEFNSGFKRAKTIHVKFGAASIERLNQRVFKKFHSSGQMDDECLKYAETIPFIVSALRVDTMSFTFKDEWGGHIDLNYQNIDQIVKIHADVKWSIKNNMTLEIESPKFIGYTLAQLRPEDDGYIKLFSNRVDENGRYIFDYIKTLRSKLSRFVVKQSYF